MAEDGSSESDGIFSINDKKSDFAEYHQKLLASVQYLAAEQRFQIEQAFCFALQGHAKQKRDSGESYIIHPLVVASILAELRCDYQSIVAALLHDLVEDTQITLTQIESSFGTEVAKLVDGVTKTPKLSKVSLTENRGQSLRKMILAMASDIRVILIKLADRLHNMRTLQAITSAERRHHIARDTLEIYAPIAQRMGIFKINAELIDLAFNTLYPRRYRVLEAAVEHIYGKHAEIINQIKENIKQCLSAQQLGDYKIVWRLKSLYSIYCKMIKRRTSFMDITDIYGMRIVVSTIDSCYRALGIIHQLYKPIPGKFKDYIALPKQNGYQSLHTVLLIPSGIFLEVQIRTQQMDHAADFGIASHWLYKDETLADLTQFSHVINQRWMRNLLDMQFSSDNPVDFLAGVKSDLSTKQISVFTPKGEVIELVRGATPVDFAYAIHTAIGNGCVSAMVNRQFVPLSTVLQSGQTVAIITAAEQEAAPDLWWLNFVVTGRAKCAIRHYWHGRPLTERVALGRRLLKRALKQTDFNIEQIDAYSWSSFLRRYHWAKRSDFYAALGGGELLPLLTAYQLINWWKKRKRKTKMKERNLLTNADSSNDLTVYNTSTLATVIKGAIDIDVRLASCCMPIPGDNIVGYLNAEYQLEVHAAICSHLRQLASSKERILAIDWAEQLNMQFHTMLVVQVTLDDAALQEIKQVITSAHSTVIKMTQSGNERGYKTLTIELLVDNIHHLEKIMRHIGNLATVLSVTRKN